jgi:threonyl-tRNA synthetase
MPSSLDHGAGRGGRAGARPARLCACAAEAVQNLFPGTQITFGPATEDGFYYDFAPKERPFTEEDLPAIEEEMRRVSPRRAAGARGVDSRRGPANSSRSRARTFKAEWVMELPGDETITMYRSGGWMDLCRGPHLASTGKLDPQAFKLTRVSGAYWRGDQKNAMLSRIYGTGWLNRKQLDAHLLRLEEAAKARPSQDRPGDGPVPPPAGGAGLGLLASEGLAMWRQLEAYMRRRLDAAGYQEIKTPQLIDNKLWVASAIGASSARICSWCPTRCRRPKRASRSSRARVT